MTIRDTVKRLLTRSPDAKAKTARGKDGTTPMDIRRAECPYCKKALDKIPSRKTKCPHCREYMYVRTRPSDGARVVVTKAGADKFAEEWEKKYYLDDFISRDPFRRAKFEKERARLEKQSGKEPSDRDVMWRMLNQELDEHFRHKNFGLYRCTRLDMAEILRKKDMRLEPALRTYLEVSYLDFNGPNNLGEMRGSGLSKDVPAFNPNQGFLEPGVGDEIEEIMKELKFNKDRVKLIFVEHNSRVFKPWKLPLTPEDCWSLLEREIGNANIPYDDRGAGQRED
jgi:hypothetical protein